MIDYYLGEEPLLPNVETYDLVRRRPARATCSSSLDRMVVKPVDGSGGYGLVIGTAATEAAARARSRATIEADPRAWIAQPIVTLSTCPTVVGDGAVEPRHVDLRPFAVNDGDEIYVLPGGLTRVALPKGSLVVNSSQGGGSKDTWVLDEGEREVDDRRPHAAAAGDARTPQRRRPPPRARQRRRAAAPAGGPAAAVRRSLRRNGNVGRRTVAAVLSRLAESFYWIGRYLERAEATARLLAEHYHLTVEDRSVPDDVAAAVVLDALSLPHDVVTTPTELVRALLGDVSNPSTVIGSVGAARENARRVRDALSGDVFEALNGAYLTLTRGLTAAASPGAVDAPRARAAHGRQRRRSSGRCRATRATSSSSLGRSLERIDMTARLLDVRHDLVWPDTGPVATLRCGRRTLAVPAHRRGTDRRHGARVPRARPDVPALDAALARSGPRRPCAACRRSAASTTASSCARSGSCARGSSSPAAAHDPAVHRPARRTTPSSPASSTAAAAAAAYFRQAGTIVWSH